MRRDAWFGADRPAWKRGVAHTVAAWNRGLDALPPCRWLYRRQLRRALEWSRLVVPGDGLDGVRAVFLSDVHLGSFLGEQDLHGLFEAVAALRPELILLGGDLVHTRPREIDAWQRVIAGYPGPPAVWFAVPGNHERFPGLGLERWTAAFESVGVGVLLDAGRRLAFPGRSGTLWVGGVDDLAEGEPEPARAVAGWRDDAAALVLSHHPDCFEAIEEVGPPGVLVLAGHTHGGQIAPGGRVLMRHSARGFHRGLHRIGRASLYVGRGVGAAILPCRIGAAPEVVVVEWRAGCDDVALRDTAVGLANARSINS